MDFLNWSGPAFLGAYVAAAVAVFVISLLMRAALCRLAGGTPPPRFQPDPYDLAYLTAGPAGVGRTALATLVHRQVVAIDPATRRFAPAAPLPSGVPAVEKAVYDAARVGGPQRAGAVAKAVADVVPRIHARLAAVGLTTTGGQAMAIRLLPAVPLLAVMAAGVAKIVLGVERHKPVGFLVTCVVLAGFVVLGFLLSDARTTAAGNRAAAEAKRGQSALEATARSNPAGLAPMDVAMAFALFGPVAFAAGPIHESRTFFNPAASAGGSGCSSSSGGTSSCSSSSDSGGSSCGGGGGCGGCGGGGGD